jgi:hypothetical protein
MVRIHVPPPESLRAVGSSKRPYAHHRDLRGRQIVNAGHRLSAVTGRPCPVLLSYPFHPLSDLPTIQVLWTIVVIASLKDFLFNPLLYPALKTVPFTQLGDLILAFTYTGLWLFTTYAFFVRKRYFKLLFVLEVLSIFFGFIISALWVSMTANVPFSRIVTSDQVATHTKIKNCRLYWDNVNLPQPLLENYLSISDY